ncbi:DegT/DnrJ/EryC1/StrS family aminotransferase [Actinomadura alba]|uniref:DegT/DnrJ/EryC1/StrS family aminotransferase n=1 Tax=Actinomadura alba TaxID=406431 RepID=A0ABR7LUP9_9ACTN|nr:DegT/DnrJ/EryC1/StrS family aminotransferase [Actinomadura alba]MBC6468408.1 DegT/DnrJ/EryC1/StrS family aminotransferase [Actinomadura alba]
MKLPYFPSGLFESERDALLESLYSVATHPSQKFILGEETARFERMLREATGAGDVIACGSGTGALTLALHAIGVGPDDEVIVPAFCAPPVASTVVNLGARPVFADVDPQTMVMDPAATEKLITDRTRVLMPTHVFSVMADMPAFNAAAAGHGLAVLEDAATAQGASLNGIPAGRWGDIGVYSFFQIKPFGSAGEGGAILTDEPELGRGVRMLRNHGQDGVHRFRHHRIGYNSRFDDVLAAFQTRRLDSLAERLERRARIAEYYTERFAPLREHGVITPPAGGEGRCYYVYALLLDQRDELRDHLTERGIGTHVYYSVPLPLQPAFAGYARPGQVWPNALEAGRRNLALPLWHGLTDAQAEHVADTVCEFFK